MRSRSTLENGEDHRVIGLSLELKGIRYDSKDDCGCAASWLSSADKPAAARAGR